MSNFTFHVIAAGFEKRGVDTDDELQVFRRQ
ncbi:MAG: hypothetical protein H6Q66_2581 [Firmicutes bacterium]|nr:hypothetical protein [Bacillota bacterium]